MSNKKENAKTDIIINKYGCNRCNYTWDNNSGLCPICGQPATHETGINQESQK